VHDGSAPGESLCSGRHFVSTRAAGINFVSTRDPGGSRNTGTVGRLVRIRLLKQPQVLAQQLERANLVPEPELHDRIGVPIAGGRRAISSVS
jgi:hypothetical protein